MAGRSRKSSSASEPAVAASSEKWEVIFHDEFLPEFHAFHADVRRELVAAAKAIELAGPKTGRPHVDTLNASEHVNMKELRFKAHNGAEIWRAAFAFDPQRKAIVLVAGDKQGKVEKAFYKTLIKIADKRFDAHLQTIAKAKKESP